MPISSPAEPNNPILGKIYDDLIEFLYKERAVKVVHVKHSANNTAHLMAAYASSASQEIIYSFLPLGFYQLLLRVPWNVPYFNKV